MSRSVAERLWSQVDKSGDCWLWTGCTNWGGYGRMSVGGRQVCVHRLSYELHHGPIPDGTEIDHACRNRACVRPDHLREATRKQNMENLVARSSSGFRGVYPHRRRWQARICHHGRRIHLGSFPTAEAAHEAVSRARAGIFTHSIESSTPANGEPPSEYLGTRWVRRSDGMVIVIEADRDAAGGRPKRYLSARRLDTGRAFQVTTTGLNKRYAAAMEASR